MFRLFMVITIFLSFGLPGQASNHGEVSLFETMPIDLKITVFRSPFLGVKDLGNCAQVSKSWRILSSSNSAWANITNRLYLFHRTVQLPGGLPPYKPYTIGLYCQYNILMNDICAQHCAFVENIKSQDESVDVIKKPFLKGLAEKIKKILSVRSKVPAAQLPPLVEYPLFKMLVKFQEQVRKEIGGWSHQLVKSVLPDQKLHAKLLMVAAESLGDPSYVMNYLNQELQVIEFDDRYHILLAENEEWDEGVKKAEDLFDLFICLGSRAAAEHKINYNKEGYFSGYFRR